jgi:hypothetical protein
MLFRVRAKDPWSFGAAAGLLASVMLAAAFFPAWQ